jgi:hypothetical protein
VTDCLEFRRRVGAEPATADPEVAAHRRDCEACARHQDELLAMDALIGRALRVTPSPAQPPAEAGALRRRLFAIAATLVFGVAMGLVLFVGAPRASVAREVMGHVRHEPGAMDTKTPLAPGALAAVLGPDGARLKPSVGDVSFASRCEFDGHVVPHLVVRTPSGPVTVLLLRHRALARPMRLADQGMEAVVMPAPVGSIAVVGEGVADLDGLARKVFDAVDWKG